MQDKPPQGQRKPGRASQALRLRHWLRKLGVAALGVVMVLVAAAVVGGLVRGLGFWGVLITVGAIVAVATGALSLPRFDEPDADDLARTGLRELAGKTELWLERQRGWLPPPAVAMVDRLTVQLDQLAPQLVRLDENSVAAEEVRRLVGRDLPAMIESYRSIPEALRTQGKDGRTPQHSLTEGLTLVEQTIGNMTRQIAQGDIDRLSTTRRYLEMKYSEIDNNSE